MERFRAEGDNHIHRYIAILAAQIRILKSGVSLTIEASQIQILSVYREVLSAGIERRMNLLSEALAE
jgi:hypothetical protein